MLWLDDNTPFATGQRGYRYAPITEQDHSPRIIVSVRIEGIETKAVLDTGGVYLICTPEIAESLEIAPDESAEPTRIMIRGETVSGTLHRRAVTLLAEEGYDHQFEATLFVPDNDPHRIWSIPIFLGMQGCLERLRFAVDPADERFCFGALQPDDL